MALFNKRYHPAGTAPGTLSMPELDQPLGYASVWAVMILIAVGMILYFRSLPVESSA